MTARFKRRCDITMQHATPPGIEDILTLAQSVLVELPPELSVSCHGIVTSVEEFPDETIQADLELETPYELLALYRSARQLAPGVERKNTDGGEDGLIVFRRAVLDLWCETGDDLATLVREIVIDELARNRGYSERDIQRMMKSGLRQVN
jgi:predicted Zn-dependent protease with MMP-like domain